MAKKTFSWCNFDVNFLRAIAYGKNTPKSKRPKYDYKTSEDLCPEMDDICPYPDERFVKRYREEIQDYFFNNTNHLINVVTKLQKLNYGGVRLGSNDEMMFMLRQKRSTQTLLDCYVRELRAAGKKVDEDEDDESLFKTPRVIDMETATYDKIELFPYQETAVDTMKKYFFDDHHHSGILSMPTGSGKTRTSVYFLLKEMVSRGYQVLWLAHRAMLLDQAAEQFYKFAPIIKVNNQDMETFRMVCISSKHSTIHALDKNDNLIISSVQSLCNRTMYLPNVLGDKVVIVVDEAHHTIAPSYRRIIKAVRKICPDSKLLGLTATPVRMNERDTKALMHMYEDKPIYTVAMSKLIADGTLATPKPILKHTNVDIKAIINIDEEKYLKKWGEMPDTLATKVAEINERNEYIVDEYVKNKDKYGKTIVFALNGIHCDTLNEMFKERGIRSDYVYTLKDGDKNKGIIERFRNNDREDGIDVLININILTEGSDIPDIQTVFLTRPTSSDVLLMQMVGRGLRGIGCGGTETVNVVDFCDKWSSVVRWMHPDLIFGEQVEIEDVERKPSKPSSLIPVEMIRDIVKGITYEGLGDIKRDVLLPIGWYDVNDEEGNDVKVLVYDNQLDSFKEFGKDYQHFVENDRLSTKDVYRAYFRTLGIQPPVEDIASMLCYIRNEKEFPEFYKFNERDEIDPYHVGENIKKMDLPISKLDEVIHASFEKNEGLIMSLYDNYEYYKKRVVDYILYPNGRVPLGTKIEEIEKKYLKFSNKPQKRSIDEYLDMVIMERKENLPKDFIRPTICWTDRDYLGYFGKFIHDRNEIHINCILNSESVPEEALKFVIYHECLHQGIHGHPAHFKEKEMLYPNYQKWARFLEYELSNYEIDDED